MSLFKICVEVSAGGRRRGEERKGDCARVREKRERDEEEESEDACGGERRGKSGERE